jgi:hypothetical protein
MLRGAPSFINSHLELLAGTMRAENIPATNEEMLPATKIVMPQAPIREIVRL